MMDTWNPEYSTIFAGGEARSLALHPRSLAVGECGPVVGESGEAPDEIPESEWPESFDLLQVDTPIKNQSSLSYCHSYAGAKALEIACKYAGRLVLLSGTGLGSLVTGGVNRGAGLDEVLRVVTAQGCPLQADVPEMDYRRSRWADGWQGRAKQFVMVEWFDCGYTRIFQRLTSLLLRGIPGIFGCSRPFGPHALTPVGLRRVSGEWAWLIDNSWGTSHGDAGRDLLRQSQIGGLDGYGAWGCRVVGWPSDTVGPPANR